MAIYFLIASANMAAICYVALVLALPPLLDTLGKHISPFFQLLHHLTLSYQLDLLLNVQILDWALIGAGWWGWDGPQPLPRWACSASPAGNSRKGG